MTEFKHKSRLYKVYHIYQIGNQDIISEGYVGVTRRSLSMRLGQHFQSKRPVGVMLRSLGRGNVAIRQIGNMVPKEMALRIEGELRPAMCIGWNYRAGGSLARPQWRVDTGVDTKFTAGHTPHNKGCGEKYKVTSPNGAVYYPEAFTVFCREHGLTPQNLRKVAKGIRKHSLGWTAESISG